VFVSLCYLMLRWLLQLVALRVRSHEWKELEIVVLRHELAILRRQTPRPPITALDRILLAAASRLLTRARWPSFIVTPSTPYCSIRQPTSSRPASRVLLHQLLVPVR
jgi:hypothetical protein